MKNKLLASLALTFLAILSAQLSTALAQSTAFTYQGRLSDGGSPARGSYDLTFALFNVGSGAGQAGGTITNAAIPVTNGLFTVTLDFGANFPGADRWLEIGVRTNGIGTFFTLSPRQQITPTPYAIFAETVSTNGLAAGTYANAVTFNNPANSFSGNGAGLTNLSGAAIADGTVNTNELSGTVLSNTFWRLTGNSGTLSNTHFIGTRDSTPLDVRVNNQRVMRFQQGTFHSANIVGGYVGNAILDDVFTYGSRGAVIGGGGFSGGANTIGSTNFGSSGGDYAVIGGGARNTITGDFSLIGGGVNNTNESQFSVIAGGLGNSASADFAAIGGGINNHIEYYDGQYAAIAGGSNNLAQSDGSAIGGGADNEIYYLSEFSMIPGGRNNFVYGQYSFAAGRRARVNNHNGVFVWADSQNADFQSTGNNQFLIRASGGVGIGTTNPIHSLSVGAVETPVITSARVGIYNSGNTFLIARNTADNVETLLGSDGSQAIVGAMTDHPLVFRAGNGTGAGNVEYMRIEPGGNVGIGTINPSRKLELANAGDVEIGLKSADANGRLWTLQSSGVTGSARDASFQVIDRSVGASRLIILTNGNVGIGTTGPSEKLHVIGNILASGTITGSSDRNVKEHFAAVDSRAVLEKVSALPISEWNYIADDKSLRHIGPMAQDFYSAFNVGLDDKHISMVDADGVALAAIQGLNQKLEAQIAAQETAVQAKDNRIANLEQRLATLERVIQQAVQKGD